DHRLCVADGAGDDEVRREGRDGGEGEQLQDATHREVAERWQAIGRSWVRLRERRMGQEMLGGWTRGGELRGRDLRSWVPSVVRPKPGAFCAATPAARGVAAPRRVHQHACGAAPCVRRDCLADNAPSVRRTTLAAAGAVPWLMAPGSGPSAV